MGININLNGMGSYSFVDIEPDSTINISGAKKVTINGSVGDNTKINVSGMCNVTIKGQIKNNVIINASGMSNVTIDQTPPSNIKINKSGMCHVTVPSQSVQQTQNDTSTYSPEINNEPKYNFIGNSSLIISPSPSRGKSISIVNGKTIESEDGLIKVIENGVMTTYAGNSTSTINNILYIDGKVVTKNDPRILHIERDSSLSSKHVVNFFNYTPTTTSQIRINKPVVFQNNATSTEITPALTAA
ncbi:MAG: hypothetical protein WC220_15590, partial [Pedobacter sp.]